MSLGLCPKEGSKWSWRSPSLCAARLRLGVFGRLNVRVANIIMPPRTKLERFYHRAVEYPDPSQRFEALRTALSATEEAIAHQAAQLQVRAKADLKRRGMHPDDVELELHVLHTTTKELFPRVFRGGFLVSLWALFESGVKDLGEYTRRELKLPFGLQELRAGDFLNQSEKYFRGTLGVEPFPDKSNRKRIALLKEFRNAIAHHDGNIEEIPKALVQARPPALQRFSDLHHVFAMPTAEYNAQSLELLASTSAALANVVYSKLHPDDGDA